MARSLVAIVLAALLLAPAHGTAQTACTFTLGFKALHDRIPGIVGDCIEDEHHNPENGDGLQQTTGGLLVWRKADNWTAFTDGRTTWINGPEGLVSRPNAGPLFPWEAAAPAAPAAPAAAPQPAPAPAAGQQCGAERWAVKTLSDPAAGTVNFTPQATTVDALRAIPAPPNIGFSAPRIAGVETTTFAVQAALVSAKHEDDEDFHLVIAEPGDLAKTMIVEFPDVGCSGAIGSAKRDEMAAARRDLIAACGAPPRSPFRRLTGSAMITGVGFFDVLHGQTGVAPNGIELHPVLKVESLTCS